MNEITIRKNGSQEKGYVVKIGCQTFYYATQEGMMVELNAYMRNPDKVGENYWQFKRGNEIQDVPQPSRAGAPPADSGPVARSE